MGNTEIPNNKRLAIALQNIHGIGPSKARQILGVLGMENKLAKDLTGKEIMDLREEVNRYEHGEEMVILVSLFSSLSLNFLHLICFCVAEATCEC